MFIFSYKVIPRHTKHRLAAHRLRSTALELEMSIVLEIVKVPYARENSISVFYRTALPIKILNVLQTYQKVFLVGGTPHAGPSQERIQPVSFGGAISVKSGSQVRVHYCKRDEVYFTTLLWQKIDGKMALYREYCFLNCAKSW